MQSEHIWHSDQERMSQALQKAACANFLSQSNYYSHFGCQEMLSTWWERIMQSESFCFLLLFLNIGFVRFMVYQWFLHSLSCIATHCRIFYNVFPYSSIYEHLGFQVFTVMNNAIGTSLLGLLVSMYAFL